MNSATQPASQMHSRPMHPGIVLFEKFVKPTRLSIPTLAEHLRLSPSSLYLIIGGKRSITADMALTLSKFFGTNPRYWLHLQADYDLATIEMKQGPFACQVSERVSRSLNADAGLPPDPTEKFGKDTLAQLLANVSNLAQGVYEILTTTPMQFDKIYSLHGTETSVGSVDAAIYELMLQDLAFYHGGGFYSRRE